MSLTKDEIKRGLLRLYETKSDRMLPSAENVQVQDLGHRFKCSFCEQRSVYTFWRKEGLSPAAGRLQYLGDLSKVDKSPARL
jgi:hypothetical protein